jgi:hypothetical protein
LCLNARYSLAFYAGTGHVTRTLMDEFGQLERGEE